MYDQAREWYREAIKLDSSHIESYLRLAQVEQHFGEQAECARLLSEALESSSNQLQDKGGDVRRHEERAEILEALGRIDEAINDIMQALQLALYEFQTERLNKELERLAEKQSR